MKKFSKVLGIAICGLFISQVSFAQINKRQAQQQQRINQGVASGEVTHKEAAKMQVKQAEIQAIENAARADEKMTKNERRAINHEQNEASRQINNKKHNRKHN